MNAREVERTVTLILNMNPRSREELQDFVARFPAEGQARIRAHPRFVLFEATLDAAVRESRAHTDPILRALRSSGAKAKEPYNEDDGDVWRPVGAPARRF